MRKNYIRRGVLFLLILTLLLLDITLFYQSTRLKLDPTDIFPYHWGFILSSAALSGWGLFTPGRWPN